MAEARIAYLGAAEFGAAVARQMEPALAGQPLVLLDDQGRVLAVDSRAAGAGITPGQSERQAVARCPAAVLRPASRYPIYEAEARLADCLARYAGRWQPAGLGCAYLDTAGIGGDRLAWGRALGAEVERLGGAPALGLSGSKFGSLAAGLAAGRGRVLVVAPERQAAFLADQPAGLLPLAADAVRQLRYLGIRTLGQYVRLPAAGVLARWGRAGLTAQAWARGLDDRPVVPPAELPHVAARIEFEAPVADRTILLAALMRRTEGLLAPLQARLQAVGRLALAVTRGDGRTLPAAHVFPLPTAAAEPIRHALAALLDRLAWDGEGAAEVTLTLAGITDAPAGQLALFADPAPRAELAALLDRLAARFGSEAFRMAVLADPTHPLPERRVMWRMFDG